MFRLKLALVAGVASLLLGCEPPERPAPPAKPAPGDILLRPQTQLPALQGEWPQGTVGQSVYVPVYSQLVMTTAGRSYPLTANVVVHNTDPDTPITIMSARYYGNGGGLITEFLEAAKVLQPLSSTTLVVEQLDREGGIGANFLIDWRADKVVSLPAIEAVMIGESGPQAVSFISPGRVVREYPGTPAPDS